MERDVIHREVTLCYLVNPQDQVLLMKKAEGFGKGLWNGVGGTIKPNEPIRVAVIRETEEESGCTPIDLQNVAVVTFINPPEKQQNMRCHIFVSHKWLGEPRPTEEMRDPTWFNKRELPYDEMWPADKYWVREILVEGKRLMNAVFDLTKDNIQYNLGQDLRRQQKSVKL